MTWSNNIKVDAIGLAAEVVDLRRELEQQAALLGKGSEREAKLMAACVEYRIKLEKREAENAALRADKERLEATLDGITAANERAIKRWQAAHPGKELVIPDQAKMVEWLLEQLAKFDDPHRLHAHCVRHLTKAQVAHLFGERMTEIVNSRDKLEAENAALRADKARLDWIDVDPIDHLSKIEFYWCDHSSISKIRANIDAARGEAKP